jgi:hypothetical protein
MSKRLLKEANLHALEAAKKRKIISSFEDKDEKKKKIDESDQRYQFFIFEFFLPSLIKFFIFVVCLIYMRKCVVKDGRILQIFR